MKRKDDKITLANIKFNLNACKNLFKKELAALSHTATNFFHFALSIFYQCQLVNT